MLCRNWCETKAKKECEHAVTVNDANGPAEKKKTVHPEVNEGRAAKKIITYNGIRLQVETCTHTHTMCIVQ